MDQFLLPGALLLGLLVGATLTAVVGRSRHRDLRRELAESRDALERGREAADRIRDQHATLLAEHTRTTATLDYERSRIPEQLALLERAQQQLKDHFQAVAGSALRSSNEEFLRLAHERLGSLQRESVAELSRKQENFDALVAPIRAALAQVDQKLADVDRQRAETGAEITTLLKSMGESQRDLRSETTQLVRALRAPNVRGRWGELQLRRVCELAGMLEHCDFEEQRSTTTDTGRLRPDLIVRLPGGRTVVVDAKVPLESYLDAQDTSDDDVRAKKLADHGRLVRQHMDRLGSKQYWEQFQPSPELVIMFMPSEALFQSALQQEGDLISFGADTRVFPASPLTLIALLRAVAHGWREERIAENAEEVSRLGRELHDRLRTLAERFDTLRNRLEGTVKAFNETVGTFDARVLVSARRFRELGAATGDDLLLVPPVESMPRTSMAVPREAIIEASATEVVTDALPAQAPLTGLDAPATTGGDPI